MTSFGKKIDEKKYCASAGSLFSRRPTLKTIFHSTSVLSKLKCEELKKTTQELKDKVTAGLEHNTLEDVYHSVFSSINLDVAPSSSKVLSKVLKLLEGNNKKKASTLVSNVALAFQIFSQFTFTGEDQTTVQSLVEVHSRSALQNLKDAIDSSEGTRTARTLFLLTDALFKLSKNFSEVKTVLTTVSFILFF
jgi:hypothetical protein